MTRLARRAAAALAALAAAGAAAWALLPGVEDAAGRADAADARMVALGERVYAEACAACHGAELQGQPDWRRRKADGRLPAPPHDGTGHTWHHPDAVLFAMTKRGVAALAPAGYASDMPGFAGTLSDAEIWAALAYIKSRWPEDIRARQAAIDRRAREAR